MNDFTYCSPTRYVFGRDAELKAGEEALACGWTRVMLVYGMGSVVRSGLLDRVKKSLHESGVTTVELGGVRPNPVDTLVYKGIEIARSEKVQAVIGVGGGSAIDTAKAIAIGVPYQGDFWDFYCGKLPAVNSLPVATVLTIPAAGSEGSGNSVITKTDGKIKLSLRTECLRPKFSLMNPELTYTLPAFQTACGICDMMAHILERYFTPTGGVETTDRISEGLLIAIMNEGRKTVENPTDYDSRANVMWAGTLAHNGICGCGRTEDWVCHFMEHEISALTDVAHGAGLAVMIPAWMLFMASHKPEKVAQFGRRVLGIKEQDDTKAAEEASGKIKDFFQSIGLPVSMEALGVNDADISLMVRKLHENKGATIGGYYPLTATETSAIYRLARQS